MIKSLKHLLFLVVISPLLFAGCNDLFDKGDVEQAYEGPDVVGFFPLQSEVEIVVQEDGTHNGGSTDIEIQLISSEGLASSDVSVSFAVDQGSTADASIYSISSTSVTISSGSTTSSFTITIPSDADIEVGDEFRLILNIENVNGAEAGTNLDQSTVFIQGVEPPEE